ncbi:MAG: hypothetical protein AAFN79_07005 [Pseudomonadota bacterium]
MLHVADASFFEAVGKEADRHELVLVEGVPAGAGIRLLLAYEQIATRSDIGLSLQRNYIGPSQYPHWRNSDLSADEARRLFLQTPWVKRLTIALMMKSAAFIFRHAKSKEDFVSTVRNLDDTDYEIREIEVARNTFGERLSNFIHDARDANLEHKFDEAVHEKPEDIAIVWGAAHAPRLIRHMSKAHGYRIVGAEWMNVVDL